jgi:hypothetical protein
MVGHGVMTQMNQMSFDQFMWSRGFKTTPFGC